MGIIVDAVHEVSNIKEEEIEDAPSLAGDRKIDYILGMAQKAGAVKILLDINKVIHQNGASNLEAIHSEQDSHAE